MTSIEFKNMVIPFGKKLFHFARLFLKDDDEAKDAVQETYLKLWKMKDDMATINNVEAFAMKLTKNWCLDRIKAKKPLLVETYSGQFDTMEDSASPYKKLENADNMQIFTHLLDMLTEQQRLIIHMRDIEGYEFEEIAGVTGLSVNTIRVNLSRARSKLRENLIKIDNYGQERH